MVVYSKVAHDRTGRKNTPAESLNWGSLIWALFSQATSTGSSKDFLAAQPVVALARCGTARWALARSGISPLQSAALPVEA